MNAKEPKHTAIVTGANRGLGLEICRQLAGRGLRVLLTSRDEAAGRIALEKLQPSGGEIVFHQLDVSDAQSVSALRDFVARSYGSAEVLVNNAAVLLDHGGRILEVPVDQVRTTFEINTLGVLRMCQAFLPLMLARGYGRVVNVSSDAGQIANMVDDMPAYRLSKIALNGLTLMLADGLKGTNVLVNAIHPGWVRTDMGGPDAVRDAGEAVQGILRLATLPDNGPNGAFFFDEDPFPW